MKIDAEKLFTELRYYEHEEIMKSYFHLLVAIIIWCSAYAVILFSHSFIASTLGVFIAAALTVRLFIMYHDYYHGAIFKKGGRLVKFLFEVFGILIFFPGAQWAKGHDEHHRGNSILNMGAQTILRSYINGYFVVVDTEVWKNYSKIEKALYRYRRSSVAITFGLVNFFVLPTLVKGFMMPIRCIGSWLSLLVHVIIVNVCLTYFSLSSFFCIYISLFIATAIGSYIFYAQHNFPEALYFEKEEWGFLNSSVQTTSFFKMNPILNWVTGNIGYHHLHHINPKIPFYRLPSANSDVGVHLTPHVTSWRLSDIERNFNCNIWDANKKKFIPYSEA